jgi:hypothetical protein
VSTTPRETEGRNTLSLPQQYPEPAAPVRQQRIGDELVLVLDRELALVASRTEPDAWHVVERGRCTCAGFRYREQCRHLGIATRAASIGGQDPRRPDPDAPPTFRTAAGVDDSLTRLDAQLDAFMAQPQTEEPCFFRRPD